MCCKYWVIKKCLAIVLKSYLLGRGNFLSMLIMCKYIVDCIHSKLDYWEFQIYCHLMEYICPQIINPYIILYDTY